MAITETTTPPITPPSHAASMTNEQKELLPTSRLTSFMWIMFGFVSALSGAALAAIDTATTVASSTDEFAGLAYLFSVPLGWLGGTIAAALIAWGADRNRVRAGASRRLLVSVGQIIPIGVIVGAIMLWMTVT